MSSNDSTESGQPLVFGVPSSTVAAALRNAGLDEDAVVAVLGRAIARSAGAAPTPGVPRPGAGVGAAAASQRFTFQVNIAETAPECALTYQRLFVHPDFIDGVTVVQAGQTPDEIGFNARFHSIEAEFDSISRNLVTSSNCVAELRRELYLLTRELEAKITEIDARLDAKGKDKDTKEGKESKEGKEGKETKEKDTKEGKDKEGKDRKEGKDKEFLDKAVAAAEKLTQIENTPFRAAVPGDPAEAPEEAGSGGGRTFITLDDRPDVEAAALRDEDPAVAAPAATAAAEPAAKKAGRAAKKAGSAAKAGSAVKTAGLAGQKAGAAGKKTAGTAAKTSANAATKTTRTRAKKAAPPRRRRGAGEAGER